MATDIIEGEALEFEAEPIRTLVPAQPGQSIVAPATSTGPADMIAHATVLASALRDIVERQRLYATISGKKYPQVEAWATIGRMDNVVAMEDGNPVRHDDGSYEATVQLIRLSDGMVIGRASALCGMPDDKPWATRAEYARRSMAVTRATSRAFRQQYSWIMALAGYEPTPADEMPQDDRREDTTHDGGLIGTAEVGKGDADFDLRQTPDGYALAFRLTNGRKGWKVIAKGPLAEALATLRPSIEGQRVTVWGTMVDESFDKGGKTITYQVVHAERVQTPDGIIPAPGVAVDEPVEAASVPLFDDAEQARIDEAIGAA